MVSQVCVGKHCLSQHWINYLGIYASLTGTLAAIFVARIVDYVKGIRICIRCTYTRVELVSNKTGGLYWTVSVFYDPDDVTFSELLVGDYQYID